MAASTVPSTRSTSKGPRIQRQPPVYDHLYLYTTTDKFYIVPPHGQTGECLVIDRVAKDIKLGKAVEVPSFAQKQDIFGIFGICQLIAGPYLIVITKRSRVGTINNQIVWRIDGTEMISYTRNTLHLNEEQLKFNKKYYDMINKVLTTPSFYYSTSYDLTHSMQRLYRTSPDFLAMGLLERSEPRFVWNYHMLSELAAQPDFRRYCFPIMHGFISLRGVSINSRTFMWGVISRRSVYRAGTRYYMRGCDEDGNAANFVETEMIIEIRGARSSFVQTRGSIPLMWSQYPNLQYKPKPVLAPDVNQVGIFKKHFESQIYTYGAQVIVNLIDQKPPEDVLGNELQRCVDVVDNPKINYQPFDFHAECKGMRYDRLSVLIDRIASIQDQLGYFMMSAEGKLLRAQEGVFRTNCIDCLDRTNVVQSLIGRRSLQAQLEKFEVLRPGQKLEDNVNFEKLYKNVWADNGDACSVQYAGTGALKSDFTRTGKRTVVGAMFDGWNSALRYVKNNFADGDRQDAIDLFLGNYRVVENEGTALPCPLKRPKRPVKTLMPLLTLLIAIAGIAMFLIVGKSYLSYRMLLLLLMLASIAMFLMVKQGKEYVNNPKLRAPGSANVPPHEIPPKYQTSDMASHSSSHGGSPAHQKTRVE